MRTICRTDVVAFATGLVFALGLGLSGMTKPQKVIGFLDILGDWDPSLALVMLGAISIYAPIFRRLHRHGRPLASPTFYLPTRRDVDSRLLVGAGLFGVGWGLSGLCPGPALVSSMTFAPQPLVFVAAMLVGMILFHDWSDRRAGIGRPSGQQAGGS